MKRLAAYALLFALAVPFAQAHPGHGDEAPAPVSGTAAPRAEARSDLFELVTIVRGGAVILYLDRFATNEPVTGASIEVGEGDTTANATPQPDGTYRLAGDDADLLNASLDLQADDHPAAAGAGGPRARLQAALGDRRGPMIAAFGFLLGVFSTLVFQARGRWRAAMGGMALLSGLLVAGAAFAHPGHDGDEPAPPAATDAPRRQPDGSVSMPKDAQRLLAIRTVLAAEGDAARTVQVIGQVVADPGAAGRVQASQPGRVGPGDQGLARLGQLVEKGDVLAVVTPSIGAVERGGVQAQVAELDAAVKMAQAKVTRLSALAGSVPGKDIDDARLELDGARKRRAALSPSLTQGEILRAPVSGVVSVANAQVGALVESKDILFEIVDPARLWVEATLTDPSLAGQVKAATAVTADGTRLAVTFIGRGMTLRQGAVPLQFQVDGSPPGLSVGTPVTVIAELDGKDRGVALPRAAVIRQANGLSAVWNHVSAERFVARPVRVRALDAGRVLVLDGLASNPVPRVVVQGAELLGQVR
jgi:cobalt-zinc-cadmium efflux system membrane fusion protein